jgi:hypothetical protein
MLRLLNDHIINPANDKLTITVEGEAGVGGAHHRYHIDGFSTRSNPDEAQDADEMCVVLLFQNGPIAEVGVNGITHEALLAVLIDRLRGFQSGQFKSKENACALTHLEEALHWLNQRTIERMRRGVEGTHTV